MKTSQIDFKSVEKMMSIVVPRICEDIKLLRIIIHYWIFNSKEKKSADPK